MSNAYEDAKKKLANDVSDFKDKEVLSKLKITPQSKSTKLDELLDDLIFAINNNEQTSNYIFREDDAAIARYKEKLNAFIESKVLEGRILELKKLPIFYEWTENEDRIDSQASLYIKDRLAELEGRSEK